MTHTIGVLGSGSWGTGLGVHLARTGHEVRLWARDAALVEQMAATRTNATYLAGIELPDALRPTHVLEDAIAYASAKGVTIVAAAGNQGRAVVSFPASDPRVIAVGAVGRRTTGRAYYSNYGKALDLMAPGGDGEIDQTGFGDENGVLAQTLKDGPSTFCYCFKSSTSSATVSYTHLTLPTIYSV